MERAVVIGGFGGQGILFAGQVLAQAALEDDREVSWLPSYGPEMRGGTASCTVIVADRPIGSPIVDVADAVIALNPPSLTRFEPLLAPHGVLVVNSSLIEAEPAREDLEVLPVPCSAAAADLGDERLGSVVALGALLAKLELVRPEAGRVALSKLAGRGGRELVERNLQALGRGAAWGSGTAPTTGAVPQDGSGTRA
jgi:2-oxoglutarate ferredoxin oxidoreductase subunit gamma